MNFFEGDRVNTEALIGTRMDSHENTRLDEAHLVALLASLKVTPTPEACFEERFLYDFHENVARETVCCPAHRRVWEHLMQMFTNFGRKRIVYGASTFGVGALAMGFMTISSLEDESETRVQVAKRFDNVVSSLVPGLSPDCESCTSIRIRSRQNSQKNASVFLSSAVPSYTDYAVDACLHEESVFSQEKTMDLFSAGAPMDYPPLFRMSR